MRLLLYAPVLMVCIFSAGAQQQCARCHPSEVRSFLETPMANSISHQNLEPAGSVLHAFSGSKLTIVHRDSRMQHRLERHQVASEYTVADSIGAGTVGRSYLVRIGQSLFQSPASWYTRKQGWDMSPGYANVKYPDFNRRISEDCLFCHTGPSGFVPGTADRYADVPLQAISCERCHGPVQSHLENPVKGSIVNPVRLSPELRNSVCEQCHLEGEARILNPGKNWRYFKPGEILESVFTTYVRNPTGAGDLTAADSQAEQLAKSKCLVNNTEKLWCGTCHRPHAARTDRAREIREVCLSCHARLLASKQHPPALECVSCHMPRFTAEDVAHSSITNHRIVRSPATPSHGVPSSHLVAWRTPPSELSDRNLGLAYFQAGYRSSDPDQIAKAYDILARLPTQQRADPQVLMALGTILLSAPDPKLSLALFKQARALAPANPRYAYLLGIALDRAGDRTSAIAELKTSIRLDPVISEAYVKLAEMYRQTGQEELRRDTLKDYLRLVPQNLALRGADR